MKITLMKVNKMQVQALLQKIQYKVIGSPEEREKSKKEAEIAAKLRAEKKKIKEEEKLLVRKMTAAYALEPLALTCKSCKNLALPVLGSDANYICLGCDNRFSGRPHYLGQTKSEAYPSRGVTYYFKDYAEGIEYLREKTVKK